MTSAVSEPPVVQAMLRKFRRDNSRLIQFKAPERKVVRTVSSDFQDVANQHAHSLVRSASSDDATVFCTIGRHKSAAFFRGEGVRTVVLARTKKGYGFVLRGAKGKINFLAVNAKIKLVNISVDHSRA